MFTQNQRTLPDTIGDLNAIQLVEVVDQGGQVLLHGTMKTSSNTPKEIERKAELMSPTGQKAKGKIEIEIEHKESSIENEVEVRSKTCRSARSANCGWMAGLPRRS